MTQGLATGSGDKADVVLLRLFENLNVGFVGFLFCFVLFSVEQWDFFVVVDEYLGGSEHLQNIQNSPSPFWQVKDAGCT